MSGAERIVKTDVKSGRDYAAANWGFHKDVYARGYGIQYPEGHVIRAYERVLKYELGFQETSPAKTLLDFGCGNGTHVLYFQKKHFEVYGVDADPIAIRSCKERMSDIASHFKEISPKPSDSDFFPGVRFDVILSNQVLYYLSDSDLERCIETLWQQTKPNGVFIATMMAKESGFYAHSEPAKDGLRRVRVQGRENGESYINFTNDKEDLKRKFVRFNPLHVGHYDTVIREEEGSGLHYLFIGQKK